MVQQLLNRLLLSFARFLTPTSRPRILLEKQMSEPAVHLCVHLDGPVHLPQQQQLASPDTTGQHQYQQRLHASAEICCGNIVLMAHALLACTCAQSNREQVLIRASPA